MSLSLQVHLAKFEGPLGLLLHLIKKEEMDIFDININEITRQYLDYIRALRELDLESAGDFVAMAATLIQIKSRMLLPDYQRESMDADSQEDPRRDLVKRLLEYQMFKDAAVSLARRPRLGRDTWGRLGKLDFDDEAPEEIEVSENPLFALISAYRFAVKNMKSGVHRVATALQSIASRILELRQHLIVGERTLFAKLIDTTVDRAGQTLITFLSVLELGRLGFVSVFQSDVLGDIHILLKRPIERDVVERVEDFEAGLEAVGIFEESKPATEMGQTEMLEIAEVAIVTQTSSILPAIEPHPREEAATDDEIEKAEAELGLVTEVEKETQGEFEPG